MNIEQIKDIKLNFILATARTGSTLLSSMLNTHPNVISTIEEPFAYSLYPKYSKIKIWTSETIQTYCYDFYLFCEGFLEVQFGTRKDLETLLERYKTDLTFEIVINLTYLCFFPNKDKNGITMIVDKQLRFHLCLEKVARFYPQSKFIILHRDPRDQCLAKFKMLEKKNKEENYYRLALTWKYVYNNLIRLKEKLGNNRFLEIKYEDLILSPEMELKKICSFLDITYNSEMLKYDKKINSEIENVKLDKEVLKEFNSFHEGLRQKINIEKIDLWKKELKLKEANLIWTASGKTAEAIGYKRSENFIKQKKVLKDYITDLLILRVRLITNFYHYSPFIVKYYIKIIKYSRKFKSRKLTSKDFYKSTYYNT